MKKLILAITCLTLTTISCKTEQKKVTTETAKTVENPIKNPINSYKVNINDSKITWKGGKAVVNESHNGDIKIKTGVFSVENGTIKAGEFVIDMTTINTLDLKEGKKEKLDGHLKHEDFFNTAKFPKAKFVVTGTKTVNGKTMLNGNLTLKDVTKNISFPVVITESNDTATIKSEVFNIDRTDFGIKYGSGKFFDNLKNRAISDLIEFTIDLKAIK